MIPGVYSVAQNKLQSLHRQVKDTKVPMYPVYVYVHMYVYGNESAMVLQYIPSDIIIAMKMWLRIAIHTRKRTALKYPKIPNFYPKNTLKNP